MDFVVKQHSTGSVVVSKTAKLTASNAAELKEAFHSLNKGSVNTIILDLEETKYCDSSGLSAILLGNRLCKDTNGRFILTSLQPTVLKVIQIAQLDKVLQIFENQEEALKTL